MGSKEIQTKINEAVAQARKLAYEMLDEQCNARLNPMTRCRLYTKHRGHHAFEPADLSEYVEYLDAE